MRCFILQNNIARFRERLAVETDPCAQRTIQGLLRDAERELAVAEAEQYGAHSGPSLKSAGPPLWDSAELSAFRAEFHASDQMLMLLDHGPGLRIVDINRRFVEIVGVRREDIVGTPLFEAFPDNPGEPDASGVQSIYDSLKSVLETSRPHVMDALRYDVQGPDGCWVERWWRPMHAPLFDEHRRLVYLLQSSEEVEAPAAPARARPADTPAGTARTTAQAHPRPRNDAREAGLAI